VRLLHQDPTTGYLKLRLETPSDLWRIARLIRPGDRVGASTTRRDPEAPEEAPAAHRERRRVWLTVRAEQVEFHGFTRHVRVTGPIVEGPFDLGRHHTLDLADGEEVGLLKQDSLSGLDRALLDEGLHARGDPEVLIAAVDWGESALARASGRSVRTVAEVNRTLAGKRFQGGQGEKDRAAYVEELLEVLEREAPSATALVLTGPGFLKEELMRRLAERQPSLRAKIKVFPAAEAGPAGIQELLRSGRASEALAGVVAAEEAGLIERLVAALGGGRRAAVGLSEVAEAVAQGAPEVILLHESRLHDAAAVRLVDRAREARARLFVVRDEGEAGRRLLALGGVAAILRFDWTPSTPRARSGAG
jgi:protein pelota